MESAAVQGAQAFAAIKPPQSPATGAPLKPVMLSVRPPDGIGSLGQETTVDVLVDNVEGLLESTFTMTYDPKVLEYRGAQEGEFLKRGGTATMSVDANPVTGTVAIQLKRAEGDPGATGSGVIASLTFLGKAPGVSLLGLETPKLVDAGKTVLSAGSSQGVVRVR
jgi:general secretion pathway protein D